MYHLFLILTMDDALLGYSNEIKEHLLVLNSLNFHLNCHLIYQTDRMN